MIVDNRANLEVMMTLVVAGLAMELTSVSTALAAERVPIRVACVGDSITYGFGLADRERESYPARLAEMLGDGYEVRGFGVNGATLLKRGTRPYWSQSAYADARAFRPAIVIVQLGTNDTNPQTWPQHGKEFVKDYTALIESFRQLDTVAQVFVCLPPPLFRDRGKEYDTDAILSREILPQIREVALRSHATVIDVHSAVADKSALFPDGVHPNAGGARRIAEAVYQALVHELASGHSGK
jgi:sialate O-acetylesterase